MLQASGVESGGSADDPVNLVPFGQEELGQVATVLSGDTSDESNLALSFFNRYHRFVLSRACRNTFTFYTTTPLNRKD